MTDSIDPNVVQRIAEVIRESVAEDWIWEFSIDARTRFSADLELESIELVTIAAGLQAQFGSQVDLISWLSSRPFDELIELSVGDIAAFVSHAQRPAEA